MITAYLLKKYHKTGKNMKRVISLITLTAVLLSAMILSQSAFISVEQVETAGTDTWTATDGLGRTISTYDETGDKKERFVGLFYWSWHDQNGGYSTTLPYNNTTILNTYPDAVKEPYSPAWGPLASPHVWNESLYGYYRSSDKWVIRKHAELLADAGVDVILLDFTNASEVFKNATDTIFDVFKQAFDEGVNVPKISFVMNFQPNGKDDLRSQTFSVYESYYKNEKYKDLWFYWKGKPLLVGMPSLSSKDEYEKEIKDFFTFRPCSNVTIQMNNRKWTWSTVYPQTITVLKDENGYVDEMTSVSAAMATLNNGEIRPMSIGLWTDMNDRTFSPKEYKYDDRPGAVSYGAHFADQFEYAIEQDPEFIFITGWNEWMAIRYISQDGTHTFFDQFTDKLSRDIEMSIGELKDHYYYQMVDYIRKYKGTSPVPDASEMKVIDISDTNNDYWADVSPFYPAYQGNTFDRDCRGYGDMYYTNTTGRNDITGAKVARDSENIYFMVETKETLTPRSDDGWMRLLIDVEGQQGENWETFEYIVNRNSPTDMAALERSIGGWNWEEVGKVYYNINGNRLQIKIPKKYLGIERDEFTINFKWSDNMQKDGDIMDFYINGDTAPLGRFKYSYKSK